MLAKQDSGQNEDVRNKCIAQTHHSRKTMFDSPVFFLLQTVSSNASLGWTSLFFGRDNLCYLEEGVQTYQMKNKLKNKHSVCNIQHHVFDKTIKLIEMIQFCWKSKRNQCRMGARTEIQSKQKICARILNVGQYQDGHFFQSAALQILNFSALCT